MAELSAQAPVPHTKGRTRRVLRHRQSRNDVQQATDAGLDLLRVLGWLVLHDVVVPGDPSRGQPGAIVDHLLAGPAGVYVVNTVNWSGPLKVTDDALTVGKVDRAGELAEARLGADAVRAVLPGIPVAPMLCFERLEDVTGVVAEVALCASENILDLLTTQPPILDAAVFARASRTLGSVCRPDAREEAGARSKPEERVAGPAQPTIAPAAPAEEPALAVASADEVVQVAAFERLVEGHEDPAAQAAYAEPEARDGEESSAAIHEAGAALWRDLTAVADEEPGTEPVEDVEGVEVAVLEAQLWEREVEEDRIRAAAEVAAKEARDRKAREAVERVEREALRLAEQELAELAERDAHLLAQEEAQREAQEQAQRQAQREADERAERERVELERAERERVERERAELERAEQERVERERAELERAELERAERERAELERAELERAEREQAELERAERERVERERAAQERVDHERDAQQHAEQLRAEQAVALQQRFEREAQAWERALTEAAPVEPAQVEAAPEAAPVDTAQAEPPVVEDEEVRARADRVAAIREREAQRARERAERDATEDATARRRRLADPLPSRPAARPAGSARPADTVSTPVVTPSLGPAQKSAPKPTAVSKATTSHREDEPGERRPTRAVLQVALGALLVAGVIIAAPHVPDLVAQAQSLVGKSSAPEVGTAVEVKATDAHPAVTVLAGQPLGAHATGAFRAAKGEHLVAVPIRLTNGGMVRWDVAVPTSVTLVDSAGTTRTPSVGVAGLDGLPLLGSRTKIAPGKAVTGYVAFSVPDGRDVRSVSLRLSPAGGDTVTWQVAH